MAKKYIDTDTAYEVLTEYYHHKTEVQHKALREALDRVPAADVVEMNLENDIDYLHSIGWMQDHDRQMMETGQEVRHGEWIVFGEQIENQTFDECKCSECGCVEYFNKGWKHFNYCPNCGASMRGDEDG